MNIDQKLDYYIARCDALDAKGIGALLKEVKAERVHLRDYLSPDQHAARICRAQNDATFRKLVDLAGAFQDDSITTLHFHADDATRTWHLDVGKRSYFAGTFASVIHKAHAAERAEGGPEFEDGHDHEGFPGGCQRFGHAPKECPEKAPVRVEGEGPSRQAERPELSDDTRRMPEELIRQLPENHDGRNTWLLNYGRKEQAAPEGACARNCDCVGPCKMGEAQTRMQFEDEAG